MFNFNTVNLNNSKQAAWMIAVPTIVGGTVLAAKYGYSYFTSRNHERSVPVEGKALVKQVVEYALAGALVGAGAAMIAGDKNVGVAVIKASGAAMGASLVLSGDRLIKI